MYDTATRIPERKEKATALPYLKPEPEKRRPGNGPLDKPSNAVEGSRVTVYFVAVTNGTFGLIVTVLPENVTSTSWINRRKRV